jgi:hypothetical protein
MAQQGVTVPYFYKITWGFHDEWWELFTRNHYPILKAQIESGRLLDVRGYGPRFHGEGRADWTYLVTITYRDWAALEAHSEAEITQRLFPDQDRYQSDERRRFELIEAHWDVPLEELPLP